jgi:hypothetical protein
MANTEININDFERQCRVFFVNCLMARGLSNNGANDLADSLFGNIDSTQGVRTSPGQAAVDTSMVSANFDNVSKLVSTCTGGLEAKKETAAEKQLERMTEAWDEEQRAAQESIQKMADALNDFSDSMFSATVLPLREGLDITGSSSGDGVNL